jgi:hypothetical protein
MKTFNLIFALAFSVIASFSFASNGNYFVVEQEGENMVMYLNVENSSEIASVTIDGNYFVNGVLESFEMNINSEEAKNFNNGLAKIQNITSEFVYASYTLSVTNTNGEVLSYPSVVLDMEMMNMNLAKN